MDAVLDIFNSFIDFISSHISTTVLYRRRFFVVDLDLDRFQNDSSS